MRPSQTVRRLLLLGALALVISFAWRTLAVTHATPPAATSLAGRDRESAAIGVALNGQSRAYPLQMLGSEVLNDELGGQPIVVTFWPLCYSSVVYARTVQGRSLTFELWPGLERGVLVMRDRETGSLWSQLTGMALDGSLRGQMLHLLPSHEVSLGTWRRLHPDSGVYTARSSLSFIPDSFYSLGQPPQTHSQYVLGSRVGSAARGYPLPLLDRTPVFEDELGGVPIVIGYDPVEGSGLVWDRIVGGRAIHFTAAASASLARDDLGDTWDLVRGVAVDGPHKGQSLNPRWTTLAYVDNWRAFFGGGSILGE